MLTTVTELRERGVRVVSLTENFDLETKEGRFMLAVLAAAAARPNSQPCVATGAARTLKIGSSTAYAALSRR